MTGVGDLLHRGPVAVVGAVAVRFAIGAIVLSVAEPTVLSVARSAARDVRAAFWRGVLMQLAAVPLLGVALLACVLSLVGILAIPLVLLAWAIVSAGAWTLGSVGVTVMLGHALAGGAGGARRASLLRGLTVGTLVFGTLWVGAATLSGIPVVGMLARLVALGITWAASTVGLGAVLMAHGGVAHLRASFRRGGSSSTVPSWQTPTPMQGVVATRRPTAADPLRLS